MKNIKFQMMCAAINRKIDAELSRPEPDMKMVMEYNTLLDMIEDGCNDPNQLARYRSLRKIRKQNHLINGEKRKKVNRKQFIAILTAAICLLIFMTPIAASIVKGVSPAEIFAWGKEILFYPDDGYTKETESSAATVRILVPDSGYPTNNFSYVYRNAVSKFEAETGVGVEFFTIPAEEYETELLLKLLSNENDFDLYLIPNAVNTSVFRSIVEKKAYYSLKDAEALKDIYPLYFDGYEQMITVNDDICGVPMHVAHNCLEINRELFDLYDLPIPNTDWTLDDLWNLCDIIYERGLNIKVLANGELQLIGIIAGCLEYTDFDADALESLFAKIHDYTQKGVLAFDNEPSAFYYSLNRDKPALFYQAKDYYAVPDAGSIRKNHENFIPFPRYNQYAPYYMRVFDILAVNAQTLNAENSIRFLSVLMQSKSGNVKNFHKDQISDFDKLVVKNSRIHCLYNDEMFEQTHDVYLSLLYENIDPEKSAKDFLSAILYGKSS